MTIAGLASLLVRDRLLGVPIVSLLAIVTVPASRVILAFETDSAGHASRQLEELHVEPAPAGVVVALAGDALVGREGSGSAPRPVEVKRFALFALTASSVVLALTCHFTWGRERK